ncbi:MAG: 4Fe-4S dicluster domain-containing protein [Acidobacteria bacterium]|nr:4Fe-4S dicluster domain-containing protein [Acidobacteriota bacterium]
MASEKQYWKSLWERGARGRYDDTLWQELQDEFPGPPEEFPGGWSRRGFLRAAGFALAGAVLTGCNRAPVQKAIPLLVQPEFLTPGQAVYYASTCGGCAAGCGILIKNRDGRPIKLEGNRQHPLSRGGLCAVGQASVLGLYDSLRLQDPLKEPVIDGKAASWQDVDTAVMARLRDLARSDRSVCFLSDTNTSPTRRAVIGKFLRAFPNSRHVVFDPLSSSAILDAHEQTHGARVLPQFRFDRADVVIGLAADFLGTWISPVEFAAGYASRRTLESESPRLSYHAQLESHMSVTGSKADLRRALPPSEIGLVLNQLAQRIKRAAGSTRNWAGAAESSVPASELDELAARLWESRERSLVVCGVQDVPAQIVCNYVNHLLGSYGNTLDIEHPSLQRQGNDRELQALLQDLRDGKVAALLVDGVDPVAELPEGEQLAEWLEQVPLKVSFQGHLDETSRLAQYVCPDNHYLESWSDAEPVSGVVSLAQPAIAPLGNRRSLLETLSIWAGEPKAAYNLLRDNWRQNIFPRQRAQASFDTFWELALHDGYAVVDTQGTRPNQFNLSAVRPVAPAASHDSNALELVLYPKVGMLSGAHAGNPWLQELPDPISKVTWDNYACISPATAARLGISDGDVISIKTSGENYAGKELELPALIQPGQHDRVIAIALGYGRRESERFAKVGPEWLEGRPTVGQDGRVGKNAAPLLELRDGVIRYTGSAAVVTKTGQQHPLASIQDYYSLSVPAKLALPGWEPRPIVQETTWSELQKNPRAGSAGIEPAHEDLWPRDHPTPGHRWAMVIDLAACTGCSACVIGCQAENNVPVVGQDEVRRRRAMHWMRIDRYYSETSAGVEVAHQPMLCQHCEHAPCETVCPVLATVHSEEGLNQQIYNRCIGTRYCSNNCPYKVRRFNWFDYPRQDPFANLVLNPDVTVRSRGIMEKCTFCVQRIQDGKAEAKRKGVALQDGDIQTACQQSCPTQAIVFGDINDPGSRVSQLAKSGRHYRVLEEINVRPSIGYLRLVRNRAAETEEKQSG